jgi:hypothetical protein
MQQLFHFINICSDVKVFMNILLLALLGCIIAYSDYCYKKPQLSFLATNESQPGVPRSQKFIDYVTFKKIKHKKTCVLSRYKNSRQALAGGMSTLAQKVIPLPFLGNETCAFVYTQVDQETGDFVSMPFISIGNPIYSLDPECIKGLYNDTTTINLAMKMFQKVEKVLQNRLNGTDFDSLKEIEMAAFELRERGHNLKVNPMR